MFCEKCGTKINDGAVICIGCGCAVNSYNGNSLNNTIYNYSNSGMRCPRCGNNNTNVQLTNQVFLKTKRKSALYWLFIGWWLELFLWFFLTIPRLLILLFVPKNKKIINKTNKTAVCQNCGNSWRI